LAAALLEERQVYQNLADGVCIDKDAETYTDKILAWWRANGRDIPAWSKAARMVFAMAPSSGSVERVFSQLRLMYNDRQNRSLSEYVEAGLMLRYNKRPD
jgi:hypothetical protein